MSQDLAKVLAARPDAEVTRSADTLSLLTVEGGSAAWGFDANQVVEILLERDWHGRCLDIAAAHDLPTGASGSDRHLIVLAMWVQPILVVGRLSITKVDRANVLPLPQELLRSTKTIVESVAFEHLRPLLIIDVARLTNRRGAEGPQTLMDTADLGAET